MIKEMYESECFEMGSNDNSDSRSDDNSAERLSPQRIVEYAWRDIVDYCRDYYERQTSDNS